MTALTHYTTTAAASTVATADKALANATTGAATTNKNTTIGTATGWGELFAQGTAGAWAAAGSAPAPSGNGWIDDGVLLETNQYIAGNWTTTIRLNVSVGSIVADIHLRAYQRSSGGVYTLVSDMVITGQTIGTSATNFSPSATGVAASATFATGDKTYYHCPINITSNSTGSGAAVLKVTTANSSTLGSTNAQIVTPGYQSGITTATKSTGVRALVRTQVTKSVPLRTLIRTQATLTAVMRTLVRTRATFYTALRTRVRTQMSKSIMLRMVARTLKTVSSPLRIVLRNLQTATVPLRIRTRTQRAISTWLRLPLRTQRTLSVPGRLRLRSQTTAAAAMRVVVYVVPVHVTSIVTGRDGNATVSGRDGKATITGRDGNTVVKGR